MDGAEYLRKFLADRRRRNAVGTGPDLLPLDLIEARGLVNGLVASGTVLEEEARSILAEAVAAAHGHSDIKFRDRSEIPREEVIAPPSSGPPILTRVIPVINSAQRDDTDVYAISVDLWSASFSVRFAYGASFDGAQVIRNERRCAAVDDAGSTYKEFSRSTGDAGGLLISTRFLRPALSEQAKTITVSLDNDTTVFVTL